MINYRGLDIPFVRFGNTVTSDNLFDPKEQELFDFYALNAGRYRKALDVGANIGVHTILMRQAGWWVRAFEPDPTHFAMLRDNYVRNATSNMDEPPSALYKAALSDHDGHATFVRVLGNTTGSHLTGDKEPHGPVETFEVEVMDCRPHFRWADFAKIDCEGHEAILLLTVDNDCECEFMVEVGNMRNADLIWSHFKDSTYRMWAQHKGWQEVTELVEVPTHHSHGALFIGRSAPFPDDAERIAVMHDALSEAWRKLKAYDSGR